jgi:hypothetical protein
LLGFHPIRSEMNGSPGQQTQPKTNIENTPHEEKLLL